MGRSTGIEPADPGATDRCVNHFATTATLYNLAGAAGVEPTLTVLETAVLPLNYAPKNGGGRWIRTTELVREQIYSLLRLATSLALHVVPPRGLEPPTY
jgi:hypothetical protein